MIAKKMCICAVLLWLACTLLPERNEACADQGAIQRGGTIVTDITCRANDLIVVTTVEPSTAGGAAKLSPFFMGLDRYEPIELIAGSGYGGPSVGALVPLPSAVAAEASKALPGMGFGQTRTLRIKTETDESVPQEERFATYARITWEPVTVEVPLSVLETDLGRKTKAGDVLEQTPQTKITVQEVRTDLAVLRREIVEGSIVPYNFGPAKVRYASDSQIEYELQAKVGDVMRLGPFLAKVVGVDEHTLTVDFANPLGGLELQCDVIPVRAAGGAQ